MEGLDVARLLSPISADAPAGADARYDPAYGSVQAEVSKLESPTASPPDWDRVVREGSDILVAQSKDLLITCFMVEALHQQHGVPGLVHGLALLNGLIESYWESAFPKKERVRARANALTWLVDRVAPGLAAHDGAGVHPESCAALRGEVEKLAARVAAVFDGNTAPALRPLSEAVSRLELTVGAAAPTPSTAPEATPPAAVRAEPSPDEASEAVAPAPMNADATEAPTREIPAFEPTTTSPEATLEAGGPSPAPPTADPLEALRQAIAPLLQRVSASSPAGEDARYEPAHEQMRAEVAKLEHPGGETTRWPEVERTATEVLAASKDLLAGAYLGAAWAELHGIEGLARGVLLVAELADAFWESAFPPLRRLRARTNAIDWLVARAETLSEYVPTVADRAGIEALAAAAGRLDEVVGARFEDSAPAVRPLRTVAERLALSIPEEKPPEPEPAPAPTPSPAASPPPQAAAPPAAAPPAATAASAPPAAAAAPMPEAPADSLADPAEVQGYLRKVGESLLSAGRMLARAHPKDATGYRLTRVALYLHLTDAPPAPDGVKTGIPAPPAAVRQRLEAMQGSGSWAALLEEAESALPGLRFWIDLHLLIDAALGGLGPDYTAARSAARDGLLAMIERMPEILDRTFRDGTPLASEGSRAWVQSLRSSGESSDAGGSAGRGGELDQALAAAAKLAASGSLEDAAEAFELAGAGGGRDAFLARSACARSLATAGRHDVAEGLFRGLNDEVTRLDLERWEPDLVREVAVGWYKSLHALHRGGRDVAGDLEVAFRRLSRVAPSAALALPMPKKT